MAASKRLLFPRQVYDCAECGKCCGGWRILVEPELVERVQASAPVQRLAKSGYVPFEPGPDGLFKLAFNSEGRCHFLRSDKLCELHADLGAADKPRACRQFPFFLVETPEGVQAGLSFCCTAVQQNQGRPLEQHEDSLRELADTGNYPRLGFGPIRWSEARTMDWTAYLEWESSAIRAFEQDGAEAVIELLGMAGPAGLQAIPNYLLAFLEGQSPQQWQQILQQVECGQPYRSRRLGRVVATEGLFPPYRFPGADIRRYLVHLVERKYFLGAPGVAARLAGLWGVLGVVHHFETVTGDFWASLELLEGEVVAHMDGLEDFFRAAEHLVT